MCSFIITNRQFLPSQNLFSQKRGPDYTNIEEFDDITVVHNLLHLTGEKTLQPFKKNNKTMVFNGEIYNYKDFSNYKTDGECILDLYEEYGTDFTKKMDGEFAIAIIDHTKGELIMATDVFATKPMWYGFSHTGEFGIATYKSSLEGLEQVFKVEHGKVIIAPIERPWYMKTKTMNDNYGLFDLNQHKDTYDDWIHAFEESVRKRSDNYQYKMFLGLSSGYDSGAICCELQKTFRDFKAYTVRANENMKIVKARHKLLSKGEIIKLTKEDWRRVKHYVRDNCEDFVGSWGRNKPYYMKKDKACVGLGAVCERAVKEQRRIYFSGAGADEIMSDYGFNGKKFYTQSQFGGLFPDNLNGLWPWDNFYGVAQRNYLYKEESVAGGYGIETRFPFLDKKLVQEFLWLKPELKNKNYKAPLFEYFKRNNYPFDDGIKIGFRAHDNLK